MKPALTIERLEPFVREAMTFVGIDCEWRALALAIIEHQHAPAGLKERGKVLAAYSRSIQNEWLDHERTETQRFLDDDWHAYVIIAAERGCLPAFAAFLGKRWLTGDVLPILPIPGCNCIVCNCRFRSISRYEARLLDQRVE